MKIVLTHPFCWPYVRRGTERCMDGLARYLTQHGHEVVTLSTSPGPSREELSEGGKRVLYRPLWFPLLARVRIQPTHSFFISSLSGLSRIAADVVHSFHFTDAIAAAMLRQRKGLKTVLQVNGPAIPAAYHRLWPPDRWMVRKAITGADAVVVCSQFVADLFSTYYGIQSQVIVPPIDLEQFSIGNGPPDTRPVILSVADFDVRHKGIRVLAQAFARVLQSVPEAQLRLSGNISSRTQGDVFRDLPHRVQSRIEVLGLGKPEELPGHYQRASVLALPSMWEGSGTVMFEAWACGTPVVATAHGGLPEFVCDEVGVLFDPAADGAETTNVEGLSQALLAGIEMSRTPGIRERCRSHAARYSWEALGPKFEAVYRSLGRF